MNLFKKLFSISLFLLLFCGIAFAGVTPFPYGVSSFGQTLPGGALAPLAGNAYYVGSAVAGASDDGNPGTKDQPFNTIDYAVGRCAENKGDRILVLPGHIETVTAASGLDLDVAGIEIVFLGTTEDQGRINLTTVETADIEVDAENIRIIGGKFTVGIDTIAHIFDVNAAGFEMIDSIITGDATYQPTACITLDANADYCTLDGISIISRTAGAATAIEITAAADHFTLKNSIIDGSFATANIYSTATNTNMAIFDNTLIRNSVAITSNAINLSGASTGFMSNNGIEVNGANPIDPGALVDLSINKAVGSELLVTMSILSSSIPNNSQTGADITFAAEGDLLLTDILVNTDSTGIAGSSTNYEFSCDNTNGVTGAALPIALEAAAGFGASLSESKKDYTSHTLPMKIESGSKIYFHGDDNVSTGGGYAYVTLVFTRLTAGALITGKNIE